MLGDHLKTKKHEAPWNALASDSLELEIYVKPDKMIAFSETFTIHPAIELPMMLDKTELFEFSGGKQLEILIKPAVIKSDESLKALEPSDRSCYFEGERELRFFKVYTKRNCAIECFSNYSRQTRTI